MSAPALRATAPLVSTARAEDVDALVAQLVGDRASPAPGSEVDGSADRSPSAAPVGVGSSAPKPMPLLSAALVAMIDLAPKERVTYSKEVQTMEIQTDEDYSPIERDRRERKGDEPGSADTLAAAANQAGAEQGKGSESEGAPPPKPRGELVGELCCGPLEILIHQFPVQSWTKINGSGSFNPSRSSTLWTGPARSSNACFRSRTTT